MPRSTHLLRITLGILSIIAFCLIGCNSKTDEERILEYEKKQAEQTRMDSIENSVRLAGQEKYRKKEVDTSLLSNENVVRKLTEFGIHNLENNIRIKTSFGDIDLKLYDDTPIHRANFINLIKNNYFDETIFYRIIDQFMIQGGNSDRDEVTHKMNAIGFYTLPDEIQDHHFHKRGALAMAVTEQLDVVKSERHKRSSSFNFYIVQNGPMTDSYINGIEKKYGITISGKRRVTYRKIGGVPHLDGDYTVFGEVTKGMSIIDKIAKQETDENDRPLKDIFLSIEIIE